MIISSSADFPHVQVYERNGPGGKIYTLAFRNPEVLSIWEGIFVVLALAGAYFGLIFLGLLYSPELSLAILFCGLLAMGISAGKPNIARRERKREIELDYGRDTFRVFKNGKLELERQLLQLKHVTVDRHPDTELERYERQEKRRKGPGIKEQTHCLFWVVWQGRRGTNYFSQPFGVAVPKFPA